MRTLFSLIVVALLLAMPAAVFAYDVNDPYIAVMIADGGSTATETYVGDLLVWDQGGNLYVKFAPLDPLPWPWYSMTLTHLEVGTGLSDIPQKNGNPIPGNFEWSEAKGNNADLDGDGTPDLGCYEIPVGVFTRLYIAAHAEVCAEEYETYPDVDSIISALPATVTMKVLIDYPANFMEITISNGGILNGSHIGYCMDPNILIDVNPNPPQPPYYIEYDGVVVSTNGVDGMDKLNYILNQDYFSLGYTHSDIQAAIWTILFPLQAVPDYYPLPPPTQAHVDAIVADADANGVGYEPDCGDRLGLKLEATITDEFGNEITLQRILISIPLECGCDTAWGSIPEDEDDPHYLLPLDPTELNDGPGDHDDSYAYDFPGKNWAHYIVYPPYEPQPAPPRMSLDSSVTTTWGSIKNR